MPNNHIESDHSNSSDPDSLFPIRESEGNFQLLLEAIENGSVTAFIGAGLSASMQPTWTALHTEMQQAALIQPMRKFNADFAPADFADFRDEIPSSRYLEILRNQFGGVVTDYPDHYRFLDEILGIDQLVTTNYDEFLATVANANNRDPRIAIYPQFHDVSARYVYLHGRAEFASHPSDLVVCEDDYGMAYDLPGLARQLLNTLLLLRPSILVGSSLKDPDLLRIIRERARLTGNTGGEPLPPIFAVVSVSSDSAAKLTTADAAQIVTSRLARLGVQAICYEKDATHSRLRSILLQMRHESRRRPTRAVFLDHSKELNRLGGIENPTDDEIATVTSLIRGVPELARHFFAQSATSGCWYEHLRESVIIPGVIEPRDAGGGYQRITPWAAIPFIERIAESRPSITVELIQRLTATAHWQAQQSLTRLARFLDDEEFLSILPILAGWMDSRRRYTHGVSLELIQRLNKSIENDSDGLSFAIIEKLLHITLETKSSLGNLRIDDFELQQMRPAIQRLVRQNPKQVYFLIKDVFLNLLPSDEQDDTNSSSW